MQHLTFGWSGHASLASELASPIRAVSVRTAAHGRPISLTLWHGDGSGIRIQSEMQELADRIEVGKLVFDVVEAPLSDEMLVDLPKAFSNSIKAMVLSIAESGTVVESGLILEGEEDARIIIVAGANPYTIAMKGVMGLSHIFEPEYPVEDYKVAPLK